MKKFIVLVVLAFLAFKGFKAIFHKTTPFEAAIMQSCPEGEEAICKCSLNKLEDKYSSDALTQFAHRQPSQALEFDIMTAVNDCKNGD